MASKSRQSGQFLGERGGDDFGEIRQYFHSELYEPCRIVTDPEELSALVIERDEAYCGDLEAERAKLELRAAMKEMETATIH